uniref:E2F/DP family winged-helix DNA-binding domain-containing protein n=1 Tax=Spongospora subterranea TaxID=70186 RepID=A0A0H5R913_9EUKA|eukprot:CRZ10615.1 hypothetical protein [Spongospora subterranea]
MSLDPHIALRLSSEFASIIDEYELGQFASSIGLDNDAMLAKASPLGGRRSETPNRGRRRVAEGDVAVRQPTNQKAMENGVQSQINISEAKAVDKPVATKQKGLRHFSLIVCEKLRQLQVTTYHSVSDELVSELTQSTGPAFLGASGKKCEAKNIRRRVYDALNVFLAIGVIRKDKKKITWVGLSSAEPLLDRQRQISERDALKLSVESKKQRLSALMRNYVAHLNINERNRIAQRMGKSSEPRLYFPFALIQAPKDAVVEAEMKFERRRVRIIGNRPFTLREDKQLLVKLGCAQISSTDLSRIIPRDIVPFYSPAHIAQHVMFGDPVALPTDPALYEDTQ